jgi:hypothetical protein
LAGYVLKTSLEYQNHVSPFITDSIVFQFIWYKIGLTDGKAEDTKFRSQKRQPWIIQPADNEGHLHFILEQSFFLKSTYILPSGSNKEPLHDSIVAV